MEMLESKKIYLEDGRERTAWNRIVVPTILQRLCCGIGNDDDGNQVITDEMGKRQKLLKDMLIDFADVEKVAVFCHHHDCMDAIAAAAKPYGTAEVSGRVADKEEAVRRWRDPEGPNVLIAQQQVASEGIDLTAARIGIFYCHQWSPEKKDQATGRLVREAQTRDVTFYEFVAEMNGIGLMDEVMIERVDGHISDGKEWMGEPDWRP